MEALILTCGAASISQRGRSPQPGGESVPRVRPEVTVYPFPPQAIASQPSSIATCEIRRPESRGSFRIRSGTSGSDRCRREGLGQDSPQGDLRAGVEVLALQLDQLIADQFGRAAHGPRPIHDPDLEILERPRLQFQPRDGEGQGDLPVAALDLGGGLGGEGDRHLLERWSAA